MIPFHHCLSSTSCPGPLLLYTLLVFSLSLPFFFFFYLPPFSLTRCFEIFSLYIVSSRFTRLRPCLVFIVFILLGISFFLALLTDVFKSLKILFWVNIFCFSFLLLLLGHQLHVQQVPCTQAVLFQDTCKSNLLVKSNKINLGTQLLAIILHCNRVYNSFHTNNTQK